MSNIFPTERSGTGGFGRKRAQRVLVEIVAARELHNLADVRDDARVDVADGGENVRDKYVRHLELFLKIFQYVDDLRLNRNVELLNRLATLAFTAD